MMGIFKQARKIDILVGACEEHRNRLHRSKTVTSYVALQNKLFFGFVCYLFLGMGIISIVSGIVNKININLGIGIILSLFGFSFIIYNFKRYRRIKAQGYTINMLKELPEVKEFEEIDKKMNVLEGGGLYWLVSILFVGVSFFLIGIFKNR